MRLSVVLQKNWQSLIKPEKLEIEPGSDPHRTATVIAEPLETIAKANPDLSLGSYPFYGPQGYGSNLVVRGRDGAAVERVVDQLIASLADIGAKSVSRVEA